MKQKCTRALSMFFATIFFLLAAHPLTASALSAEQDAHEAVASLSAQSFLLMDADTGKILSSRNAEARLPMASTTKIMTCIVALESAIVGDPVIIPAAAVGIEGSSMYLTAGEKLTLLDLLYGLMLESANDAAVSIALHISGSIESFAERMNEKASVLGMNNTHFVNPHGLPVEDHYSTAYDMALLMRYCMQNDLFAEIAGTQTKSIPASNGKSRYLSNHNRLLRSYSGCVAGKTGYTKVAGRCLVTAAKRDGKTLICTTLSAPNDWSDHKSLFEYGFSLYSMRTLAEPGEISIEIPVVGGTLDSIIVCNLSGLSLSLREEERVNVFVELPSFVYAPVLAEQSIGEAVFFIDEAEVARLPLTAKNNVNLRPVELSFWQKVWKIIKSWFGKE